jgi:ribosomal protein S18 acetylase RimI-like enzyme
MSAYIRSALVGDEIVLARLNRFAQDLHVERRPDLFRAGTMQEVAAWFRSRLEDPTMRAWIAEDAAAPVGYLIAVLHDRPAGPFTVARRFCEIDQIAVDPARRGQGIARALMVEALTRARADGVDEFEATSWSFNDSAHTMFKRLGFVPKTVRFELRGESS